MELKHKVVTGGVSLVVASASMLGMINHWEGRKYEVYLDIGGVPTVCEGHTGPEVVLGHKWTKEQCDTILRGNATKYGKGVLKCVTVPMNQNQFDALTLFAINVGIKGMCDSRAVREINKQRYTIGCGAIANDPNGVPVWSYVDKKFVRGLYNRRQFERDLCLKPIDKSLTETPPAEPPPVLLPQPQVLPS